MSEQRERSFWAWGYADRHPDDEQRRELKERVEGLLGFPDRPLLDLPGLEDVAIPEPSIGVPDDLASFCTQDRAARARHTYGKGYRDLVRGFHGEYGAAPDVVARPRVEDDVAAVLAWATEENVAVVPFGGGTSVVGGVECDPDGDGDRNDVRSGNGNGDGDVRSGNGNGDGDVSGLAGVVSLDVRELDQVLEVDETSRAARIQAGATGPELNDQLAEHGFQLRHYPQSYEFSTFGGWVATRAGGHFATRYTHIDDFVESVRAVTPAGALETRRVPASGAGPDPNRFLLGSEGAFGVITEGWVRVQPRPEYRSRATVRFDDYWDAVDATRAVVQSRLTPSNCRLLDRNETMLNELAMDGSHLLLLGFESFAHPTDADLDRAVAICERHGGTPDEPTHETPDTTQSGAGEVEPADGDDSGDDGGAQEAWRSSFLDAPYLFNALVSIGVLVDTFETAVTWERFPELHEAIEERVGAAMREQCGTGFLACRFTHVYEDGPAPYYTLLAPADPGREREQWRPIKRAASDTLEDFGATITHHHAVGRVHREHYHRETPEPLLAALRSMKRTLDPAGVMNPGALL